MPRTFDPAAHAVRRDAFVDAAERLIRTTGYEQLSVQDVLHDLGASKGAFYHYFGSKADVLEAVVERMADQALAQVGPMLADPSLSAVAKLEGVFGDIARFKAERRDLVLAVIDVWLSDGNAIVRDKLRRMVGARLIPLLSAIVAQGQREGMTATGSAEDVATVLTSLLQGAQEAAVQLFVARRAGRVTYEQVERTFAAYAEAYERILGIPSGSLLFLGPDVIRPWYD